MKLYIYCSLIKNKISFLTLSTIVVGASTLYAAHAEPVILSGADTPEWKNNGITVNGTTTNKLSDIRLNASVPTAVSDKITALNTAINNYASISTAENKSNLENAIIAYNAEVMNAQGSAANGIPTVVFNGNTTLTATAGTADQRLNVNNGNALSINVADGKILTISGNTFSGYGGAVDVDNNSVLTFVDGARFTGNTAFAYGGAVYNKGTVTFGDGSTFANNSAHNSGYASGGAFFNVGTVTFGNATMFTKNKSDQGGGFYNDGNASAAFGNGATFAENNSSYGGALVNDGTMTFGDDAVFIKNIAEANSGAVYNTGKMTFGANATFMENTSNDYMGALYNNGTGIMTFGDGAVFARNTATTYAGAIYNEGTITFNGSATFFGNNEPSGTNSISFDNGTLNFSGNGVIDMLDPMRGRATINQTAGTWYLAGTNDFAENDTDNTNFSITDGELYLYGDGEASKSGAQNSDGSLVKAGLGIINLGGPGSNFTLSSSSVLAAGGMGNAINATLGTITLDNNATLDFSLANYDKASSTSMLTLNANTINVGNNLNINLTSMASSAGDYKLLTVSKDDILFNDKITLMAAGQFINSVDFLEGQTGRVEGNDYIVNLGKYSWNSNVIDAADHKTFAHGDFTVASGDFTIDDVFADRTDIIQSTNAKDWDGTTLTKKGAGKLIFNGVNTYTGLSTVNAGSLILGGDIAHSSAQIAGDVLVASGATFGGHGSVLGDVQLLSGSTVSPGNSIGTLTVGSITFGSDSTALFEISPKDTTDKIEVNSANGGTGIATIDSGASLVLYRLGSGDWKSNTTYTLIDTTNGVNGQFDHVVNNLAFYNSSILYTPNQVKLILFRNRVHFEDIADNDNQYHLGEGVTSLPEDHPIEQALVGLNKNEALRAYDNLSGEIYGSTRSVLLMNSRYLRDAVNRRMSSETRLPSTDPVWFTSWGHGGDIDGDSNAAKVNNNGWGIAVGSDGEVSENVFAGLVLGYEHTEVKSNARSSTANIDAFHLGGYAATELNTIKLRGGMAYSYLDTAMERDIWIEGLQGTAKSDPNGWQFQIFGDVSKDFKLSDTATVSPYVNIAHVWLNFDGEKEHGSLAALDIKGGLDSTTFTTLGVRSEFKLSTIPNISLYGDLGWQHAFLDTNNYTSNRFHNVGNRFLIKGIVVGEDVALIGAGFNLNINDKNSITLGYQGQIGSNTSDHSGNVMWKVRF